MCPASGRRRDRRRAGRGQIVGGETRLTFQLGDEILSMLSGDEGARRSLTR